MDRKIRILRMRDVEKRTGFKRSNIYRLIKDGKFPKQVKLGPNSIGFVEQEIDDHLKAMVTARNGGE